MVVDDAADARFLIGLILRDAAGIDVMAEVDGAEAALAQLETGVPDLMLVDARMPVMDGFQLTRLLGEKYPGLKVALLTSMVDGVIEARAREAGAVACWNKADLEALAPEIVALGVAGHEA